MDKFIRVADRWYQKAVDCEDSFDQFISIWISFNAIYGRREGSEFRKIKSIINEFNSDTITDILSYDEVQYFCNLVSPIEFLNQKLEIEDTSEAQNILNRNITRNPRLALEKLMYILNKVRNNLFHGDKRIENSRDVGIVKHAYPIVREIVKSHLGLDDNMETFTRQSSSTSNSMEKKIFNKIDDLQKDMLNMMDNYNAIPKDHKHPISILLDRANMSANAFEHGFTPTQEMEDIRKRLLERYERNKPGILQDIEEVYNFVDKRMSEVIKNGCTEIELKKFYREYIELQRKYLDMGYQFKE